MLFLQRTPFFRLLLPVIAGILLFQYWKFPLWVLSIPLVVSLILIILSHITRFSSYKNRWFSGCGYFIFFTLLSYFLSYTSDTKSRLTHPDQKDLFLIELTENPIAKSRSFACKARVLKRYTNEKESSSSGNVYVYLQKDSLAATLLSGDKLVVNTSFRTPRKDRNPESFDFKAYLQAQGAQGSAYLRTSDWEITEYDNKFSLTRYAGKYRNILLDRYHQAGITGNEFAVLSALTLGYTDDIPTDLRESYNNAGIAHILAVSGLHVGIIYVILTFLLSFLKSDKQNILKTILIILFLWGYAFITGLAPSTMRATLMFSFVAIGTISNRNPQIYNTICLSAFIMLLINPNLLFNVGFQLSYMAVVSIVYFQPRIAALFIFQNKIWNRVWNLTAVSIAAQLGTAPLILYYFQSFPNYFLITNLFAIPLVTFIIYLAIALIIFSYIPYLAAFFAFILQKLLWLLNTITEQIEQLPGAVSTIAFNQIQVLLAFFAIIFFAGYFHRKKFYTLFNGLLCLLLILSISAYTSYQTSVTKAITVYESNRETHISFQNGRQNYIYSTNPEDLTRIASRHWNKNKIKPPIDILSTKHIQGDFLSFHGKKILILPEKMQTEFFNSTHPTRINYLIIGNRIKPDINKISGFIKADTIIADKSIAPWYINNIRSYCRENNIHFHDIREQGPFILNIP